VTLVPTAGNKKYGVGVAYTVCTKFHENWLIGSCVERELRYIAW
jgi:hypothetical protein